MEQEMTVDDMNHLIYRFVYKDWAFSVTDTLWEGPWLRIVAKLPDAYHPGETLDIGVDSPIPYPLIETEEDFWKYLMWRIWIIESHEAREFFTVDGEKIFDPHAPGANVD
jgi:hypothetical protein